MLHTKAHKIDINIFNLIFTELAPRPIQSKSPFICCGCVVVPSVGDRNGEGWRFLVEKRIAKIAKLRTPFFGRFQPFFGFKF